MVQVGVKLKVVVKLDSIGVGEGDRWRSGDFQRIKPSIIDKFGKIKERNAVRGDAIDSSQSHRGIGNVANANEQRNIRCKGSIVSGREIDVQLFALLIKRGSTVDSRKATRHINKLILFDVRSIGRTKDFQRRGNSLPSQIGRFEDKLIQPRMNFQLREESAALIEHFNRGTIDGHESD